ncbi:MAG: metallophosphoesterase [Clostridium sp.]|nr:metallophosphoesterase [Clostridium sp.]MCM1398719.1 metallophosphoesterase [Clostridium sp.]MCM1458649.1 metallophosphoesterase [Bacteroides sp.]
MGYVVCIFILAVIAVYVISFFECRKLKVTRYETGSEGKLSDPVKFACIADMHCCFANGDKILRTLADEKPDAILLAGDMIVCSAKREQDMYRMSGFINRLSEIADVYYGMGNHERELEEDTELAALWEQYVSGLNDKVTLLRNKTERLNIRGSHIHICGLDIPIKYYGKFRKDKLDFEEMNVLAGENDKSAYTVLIAHNPDFFPVYVKWQSDVILSGHNHGGLLRLPVLGGVISPKPNIFPEYDYGIYEDGTTKMIVTSGVGGHSVMVRVNNIPELVILNINP